VHYAKGLAIACVFSIPAWAHGDSAATTPARTHTTYNVTIEEMQYKPSQLTVYAGDWIVFSNKDLFPHTVTAAGKAFDSQAILPSGLWRYQATKPGVYAYGCSFHPPMKGRITVR
jgi:plastocyanin